MRVLRDWTLAAHDRERVELAVGGGDLLRIAVLDHDLVRVSLLRGGAWRPDRTWAVDPQADAPPEGRARDDLAGFPCPGFTLEEGAGGLALVTARLRLRISRPLALAWEVRAGDGGGWLPLAADRPTGAYLVGRRDRRIAHYLLREPGERVYGLGEKAGPLDRAGRRFEMRNLDAMGYDAARTDPLYKHVPFTITPRGPAGAFSLFYDNFASCWFDLGNELDNYHLPYRVWRAADGDLDLYFAWAPDVLGLVKRQVRLTGGTAFPPRWSLGYSGSTMAHTDAPDAAARVLGFAGECARHGLACDSFHLSSGYTSIGARRYVFHWNRDKFPDPEGFAAAMAAAGVRLVANVKPVLLHDHPRRAEAEAAGLFIRDSDTGAPETSAFWDDRGSHLDFTNPATVAWWQHQVTRELLDRGIAATWNDNNEFEVWDDGAICAGFGNPLPAGLVRPVQALLMVRASEAAQRAHDPARRPYLVTRSGCPGIQRHAQTWTGDNRTGWDSLRWNIRMGLGLSLSGFFNLGHDTGGFAGPRPGPELLLRWVQNGIFHPRFVIHSWNPDGSATEPWTHPEVLPAIREAFALRGRLMPYLYTCLWQAAALDEPILRPAFLDHPDDPEAWEDSDDFLLGRDLLVAGVVEEGARSRRVRLPRNATGWCDFATGAWHPPGAVLDLAVELRSLPLFVRGGAVLPLAVPAAGARAGAAAPSAEVARELALYPAPGDFMGGGTIYDDDGESVEGPRGDHCLTRITFSGSTAALTLGLALSGRRAPPLPRLRLRLAGGDSRPLRLDGAGAVSGAGSGARDRAGEEIAWQTTA